ncbi:MAG: hypothetical protein JWL83_90 [Actinomycetia bacterium]|nr:hypothetical protein [Actinomycetes bacterium]
MRLRGEDGVTVADLLIAMVITGIIMVPIAGAIFVSLHTSGATQNRIQESAGANLLSSYFGTDVQNTTNVAINAPETTAACGAGAMPSVGLLLTTGSASSISYSRGTGANQNIFSRRVCTNGAASTPVVLSRRLAATPVLVCTPDCTSTGWKSISATVVQSDPLNPGTFTTTVQGARRVT